MSQLLAHARERGGATPGRPLIPRMMAVQRDTAPEFVVNGEGALSATSSTSPTWPKRSLSP
jgi:hypothetical protein